MAGTSNQRPGTISTEPPASADRDRSMRWRSAGYWLATVLVAAELGVGGVWDIARIPYVRDLVVAWATRPTSWCCWESGRSWARSPCSARAARCSRNRPMRAPSSPTPARSSPT